ncbi:hypothetical protein BDL97_03G064700 [Sphagnum fallax]|nr:hypothetical protein BDL97_03G064700 [Sphagnum fallax]
MQKSCNNKQFSSRIKNSRKQQKRQQQQTSSADILNQNNFNNNLMNSSLNTTTSDSSNSPSSNSSSSTERTLTPSTIRKPGTTKGTWTREQDECLRTAVQRFKGRSWKKIAACLDNRTDVQCLHRWQKVLNPNLVKGYWTAEEDERIKELVGLFGTKRWAAIARCIPGRIGKQCRERWYNHLDPSINRDPWTPQEDATLMQAHRNFGNKWADIAKLLPGRSDNAIKNRFNSALKKIHGPPSTPAAHNNNNNSSSHLCCSSITGFPFLVGVESLELLPNMETQLDPNQISYHSAGSTHSVETFNIINTMADFFVADCSAADNDFTTMQ